MHYLDLESVRVEEEHSIVVCDHYRMEGLPSHLDLCVADPSASIRFYDTLPGNDRIHWCAPRQIDLSDREMADLLIELVGRKDLKLLAEHNARHRAESGRGEHHFMPFVPGKEAGPRKRRPEPLSLPLCEPGWERVFAAFADDRSRIVGEVNLTGDRLRTGLHRCELGGVERSHRGRGLGRRLMLTAIEFVRNAPEIVWLDLKVFAHNRPARTLYETLGFQELGTVVDRFRIGGQSIDDVIMTLHVRR